MLEQLQIIIIITRHITFCTEYSGERLLLLH